MTTSTGRTDPGATRTRERPLPVWRIGIAGGLTGILCCVGPTFLALLGVVSAGTAYAWATDIYAGYAWWFRLAGLAVLAGLAWWSLRRRNQCSIAGVRSVRTRLLAVVGVAVGTYAALYAVTTWLGTFARAPTPPTGGGPPEPRFRFPPSLQHRCVRSTGS